MHFVTMATPINNINGKSHKTKLKSSRNYSINRIKVKVTPLVIYGLGGMHTQTRAETDG